MGHEAPHPYIPSVDLPPPGDRVAVIVNPVSGRVRPEAGRARAETAAAVADSLGCSADIFVTEGAGHARELARTARARGVRLVIAWGGDGTINEVASALAFGPVPLGIVPAGSGNGLARELGVNPRSERALTDAIRAKPRNMDVGELGGRLFVNVAGVGVDAQIASQFNDPRNEHRGLRGYVSLGFRGMLRYVPARYRITTADASIEVRAILVTVANSAQFGNGACIAPGARVDDGKLELVVVEEQSRLTTLWHLPRLFRGTIDRMPGCSIRRISEVTIECDQAMIFHVDGEPVVGETTLSARVHPGALQIAVR